MTDNRGATGRDEGAAQTARIMEAVKQLRVAKGWSAQRLADEMAAVGIPWNGDIVVNLEHGRRRSLRVHELTALAYILDANTPQDLLVPELLANGAEPSGGGSFPVVPRMVLADDAVRGWFLGKTGPLRQVVEPDQEDEFFGKIREFIRPQVESGEISAARADDFVRLVASYAHGKALNVLAELQAEMDQLGSTPAAGEAPDSRRA